MIVKCPTTTVKRLKSSMDEIGEPEQTLNLKHNVWLMTVINASVCSIMLWFA